MSARSDAKPLRQDCRYAEPCKGRAASPLSPYELRDSFHVGREELQRICVGRAGRALVIKAKHLRLVVWEIEYPRMLSVPQGVQPCADPMSFRRTRICVHHVKQ